MYHEELETYRAVKIVPKTLVDYETFKHEALFLKTLRHPGIPLVYDVEEDLNYSYLIEEYLEGESLFALVKRLGKLSVKATVEIGIQICRIIQFMNHLQDPILYLDLQPGNLLVCENMVRLTDFDHAQYAEDVRTFGERYGTIGFAAPEQYRGEPLDCRTDVFAIGALLYFMCHGKVPGTNPEYEESGDTRELDRIIRGCMAPDKEDRYRSAEDVEQVLCEWKKLNLSNHAIESLNIVFVGAKAGIGTTHAALAMSSFLARNGYQTLYQEECDTDTIRNLLHHFHVRPDHAGVFHLGCLGIRPYYGRAVKMPYRYFPVTIKDAGTIWNVQESVSDADFYILVCGGKDWEIHHTTHAINCLKAEGKCILLWNHLSEKEFYKRSKQFSVPGFRLPHVTNPLRPEKEMDACFREILKVGAGGKTTWKRRKGFFRRKGRNSSESAVSDKGSDAHTFPSCW